MLQGLPVDLGHDFAQLSWVQGMQPIVRRAATLAMLSAHYPPSPLTAVQHPAFLATATLYSFAVISTDTWSLSPPTQE